MIDYTEIDEDGEIWELFTRDLLNELGFYIESSPSRGADAGKDLIAKEKIRGKIGSYDFKWLVSCKHFAGSSRSVSESHEQNILERVKDFGADGFIGFYSTIASSGLNSRLESLKQNSEIVDFQIFDRKLIESHLIQAGYSFLLMRYFPNSYKEIRPINNLTDDYLPLNCKICGKDLLKLLYQESYSGNVVYIYNEQDIEEMRSSELLNSYVDIDWVCKENCDETLRKRLWKKDQYTNWHDVSDLVSPDYFLKSILDKMDYIRRGRSKYSDRAFKKLEYLYLALSQKAFRELTGQEKQRAKSLFDEISEYHF